MFQRVCKRTEDGEKFTKDIVKYLEKRAKAEMSYTKTLQNLNGELFKYVEIRAHLLCLQLRLILFALGLSKSLAQ